MQPLIQAALPILLLFVPGVLFLLFGRRLFWIIGGLTVGVIVMGILANFLQPDIVDLSFDNSTSFRFTFDEIPNLPVILVGAGVAAVVGALLTIKFPRVACAVVGFLGGMLIIFAFLDLFAISLLEPVRRTILLVGGVLVALVGIRNQNQTMILLSTFIGALLILQGLRLDWDEAISAIIWLVLMLVGIIFQTNSLRMRQLEKAKAASSAIPPPTPS